MEGLFLRGSQIYLLINVMDILVALKELKATSAAIKKLHATFVDNDCVVKRPRSLQSVLHRGQMFFDVFTRYAFYATAGGLRSLTKQA